MTPRTHKRYNFLNDWLKERFGEKIYRIALDADMTCPNRDGSRGTGGCIFCAGGSGEFAERNLAGTGAQIEAAKARVRGKTDAGKFIAYFQSYSNTYAPPSRLRELFLPVAERPDIAALSIGTRPDCLGPDVMAVLGEAAAIKPLFVELGLQTVHDSTADRVNRCYRTSEYFDSCAALKKAWINIVTHVILGLPGETDDMMLETVRAVSAVTDGIKIHSLYVLKGTELCAMMERGDFEPMTLERYTDILCRCLEILPRRVVVHRLTGDPPKRLFAAPIWSADKKRVLNYINGEFERRGLEQGSGVL